MGTEAESTVAERLARGRSAADRGAWAEAFEALSSVDRDAPLAADDLGVLATAGYLTGRVPQALSALRRAAQALRDAGQPRPAARAMFWIAYVLGSQGDVGQAGGWLARAEEVLAGQPDDCAERALLWGAQAFAHNAAGEFGPGLELASRAADIARCAGDPDARGLALTQCAGALVRLGRAGEAMGLLDGAMLAVVSAEISPIAAGTVYCSVIAICQEMAEVRRAREWTEALDSWCARQPEMLLFSGQCRVHRAELLHLRGRWPEAVAEAERACARLVGAPDAVATGAARYQQAEIHRMRGDFPAAELAYRQASGWGYEPCPGLALLRLAQGDPAAAQAAIRRALVETDHPGRRARLLPAQVEIALAAGDPVAAGRAADELVATADRYGTPALRAAGEYARASVRLAEGDAAAALPLARAAAGRWRDLDVPYEAARGRVLVGLACRALGDRDGATLELDAAVQVFARLGAEPDRARVTALGERPPPAPHRLTGRELQVLRLVATGMTNHAIATELALSEKTVERHLSNVFTKIGVPSRAAATAYAYRNRLL